ncbi:MAG: sigma-54 dependent transcriptional regulator [Cyclobacteriaceae bacterium]
MKRALIIDDDIDTCRLIERFLKKEGFEVEYTHDGKSALDILKENEFHIILCDYRLPDVTADDLILKIKVIKPAVPVIIITAYSDVRVAVNMLKKGAFDYIAKPLYPDELLMRINDAIDDGSTKNTQPTTSAKKQSSKSKNFIVGKSQSSVKIQEHLDLIGPTELSVIIIGETGTGKEYVANEIHNRSARKDSPFIAIDCGALPKDLAGSELFGHMKGAFTGALADKKGSFEAADGGTLFLDEIGNLSYDTQVMLLRVLQERKVKRVGSNKEVDVDVRIIAATNDDLRKSVAKNNFREDLYHRLNEFKLQLAPLRHRKEDIPVYTNHFLALANDQLKKAVKGFDSEVTALFNEYPWYGNLRELQNVIKRCVLLSKESLVNKDILPEEIIYPQPLEEDGFVQNIDFKSADLKSIIEETEKKAIVQTLQQTGNNKSRTAEILKMDRKTLYSKLKMYGIES